MEHPKYGKFEVVTAYNDFGDGYIYGCYMNIPEVTAGIHLDSDMDEDDIALVVKTKVDAKIKDLKHRL